MKETGSKLDCFIGFFHVLEEIVATDEQVYSLANIKTCYKRNGPKSLLFGWFLPPSFDNHECAYACALLSFV